MARAYWRVSPAFWGDEKVTAWSDDARLLALYILTCRHRTAEGLFYLPRGYILADLGWDRERLAEPFAQLLGEGFLAYDEQTRLCLICNALEYQAPDNPNQETAALKLLEELPSSPLFCLFYSQAQRFAKPFAERLAERFPERLGERLGERYGKPPPPPPPPPPALTPGGSARASASDAGPPEIESANPAPVETTTRFPDLDFGASSKSEITPEGPTGEPGIEGCVGFYISQHKEAAGSLPTKHQQDILRGVVVEKLSGGSTPEAIHEAIKRMTRKGKPPSLLPAFLDEVEPELHKPPTKSTPFVGDLDSRSEEQKAKDRQEGVAKIRGYLGKPQDQTKGGRP